MGIDLGLIKEHFCRTDFIMRIAILCNIKTSKRPNRPELIQRLVDKGHTVFFGAVYDGAFNPYFESMDNASYMPIVATRKNVNPLKELVSLFNIREQIKKHLITVSLIYGVKNHAAMAIGSKLGGAKNVICVVNGSGNLFTIKGIKGFIIRAMSFPMLRIAYAMSTYVGFQNKDDEQLFIHKRLVNKNKTFVTNGSGVNLDAFPLRPMPKENRFLFLARITPSKGVFEYIAAARIVKAIYPDATFDIVGPIDDTVEVSCYDQIEEAVRDNVVDYHGKTDDVFYWLEQCRFFVYPSYHEGVPRCAIQAMSVGRPIISCNSPGCKETVEEGVNGFLLPVNDSKAIAEKMCWMIENSSQAEHMGIESRRIAEEKFDVNKVNEQLMQIMNL